MRRKLFFALALLVAVAMHAQSTIEPKRIAITKPAEGIHLYVGDTCHLTATVYPANASDKSVRWLSEDPTVASIAPHTGIVKARGVGSATIIAKTSNDLEDFVELEVLEPIVQPTTYTIRFLDWNGTELQSSQVGEYETPVYNGATPTRAGDNSNAYYAVDYTFTGWSPFIVAATSDADYTAQYKTSLTWKGNPDVVVSSTERSGIRATTDFSKEGVTLTFAQGSGSQAPGQGDLAYIYPLNMYEGNTLTIRSADTIVGIDWGTNERFETSYFSSGQIYANAANNHACWVGETTELVFTIPEGGWDFAQVLGLNPPAISIYLKVRHESLTLTDGKVWPDAALLYDFNGNGYKGGWLIDDYANGFAAKSFTFIPGKYFGQGDYLVPNGFMEDINHDGIIDGGCFYNVGVGGKVGSWSAIDARAAISEGNSYRDEDALLLHNCDLNNDGRQDMLQIKGGNGVYYYNILYQQADGSFLKERMNIMTEQEYLTQFDPSQWSSSEAPNTYGLFFPPTYTTIPFLSGVSLDQSPKRRVAKASGMGTSVFAPTKAIDMNADGRTDLVDEAQGIIYYNMGEGKWVSFDAGGEVHTADLNNDGFIDFIYPGTKLQTLIYDGNGSYRQQTLFQNIQVDRTLYVYDFDHDNDVDILVTFSAPANSTGYAYTMFFQNDGLGHFTQLEEQEYGELPLVFAACQDINGDGYYDILAFLSNEGTIGDAVYVLYGQADMTFAAPQKLFDLSLSMFGIGWQAVLNYDLRLHVEDIDNDGKMEIWATLGDGLSNTYIFKPTGTIANTAPTAPAMPEIIYENGMMRVSWGNGSDAETSTGDLTYALRIGTTSGGSEILTAHANADGSRKNFLDGNMGKSHTYVIDLRSYAPSSIYVAVQTIDAQHKGSAWSQEAMVAHNALHALFAVDKVQVHIGDTMQVVFTAMPEGYTHTWDLAGAQDVQTQAQTKAIVFRTEGKKALMHTVTAPNGAAASYVVNVEVLPVSIQHMEFSSEESNKYYHRIHEFGDYNFDGYLDMLYNNAVHKGAADYTYTKASGMWNTGLETTSAKWFDWTHNGAIDLLMQKEEWDGSRWANTFSYLPHNGVGNMTAKQTDPNLPAWPSFFYHGGYTQEYIDLLHDGYFVLTDKTALSDGTSSSHTEHGVARNVDGTWSVCQFTGLPEGYTNNGQRLTCIDIVDMDKDGFLDLAYIDYRYNPVKELKVAFNRGGLTFDTLYIPFGQEFANIDNAGTTNDQIDMREPMMADINSDGYMDIVAFRNDKAPYILYNEANERFSAPVILPLGEQKEFIAYGGQIADLDNNGYPDILILQKNIGMNANVVYGAYAYFMDADGVKSHGFISEGHDISFSTSYFQLMHVMPDEWLIVDDDYDAWRIKGATNERPQAPTNVRAVQTEDGLLIEWASATDDYTPASQMRYNLSVKHAGQTGNGAFVISPQNGLNTNAAALLKHSYISANRYLVPISYLSVGEYEIQLQAVDMQNAMSTFSPVVTVAVDRAVIDAPTSICASDVAVVSYMGEDRTGTPTWDFDGGDALGSGFGPYNVTWNTPGIKTITLTLGGETFTRTLLVDKNDVMVALPRYLFEGNTTTLDYLPKDMTAEWRIEYRGQWRTLDENGINGVMKDKLNVKDGVFTVGKNAASDEYLVDTKLELTLTNANGCTSIIKQDLTILSAADIPQIALVEPDGNGHNEIIWAWTVDANAFPQVIVLKETNIYNQFVQLAVVPTTEGYFTDLSSDVNRNADRYAIIGVMANGAEAPRSNIHQSVHLSINRGITDNTFNLIWNAYQGTEIASYSIWRGSNESNLTMIASLSGANVSYTDVAPSTTDTYYAVEYTLPDAQSAPRRVMSSAANSHSGRSNVVNRDAAKTIVYAQSLSIMSANKQYCTTADQPLLLLYAEVKPANTTIKAVQWEITNGANLATIDPSSGLLTARTPNNGGVVMVKATAKDGSGISATKQITIAAIADTSIPEDFYYTIRFVNWDGTELQNSQVREGGMPLYKGATPTKPEDDTYTYAFKGWSPTIVPATADADYTATFTATEKPQPGTPITVRLYPGEWETVYLYAWTGNGEMQPCGAWPGAAVSKDAQGWWSYTFDPSIRDVNIIWNNGAGMQTVDITHVTASTCYRLGEPAGLYAVSLIDCNTPIGNTIGIEDIFFDASSTPRKIMIDNIIYILRGEKKYTITGVEVK